MANDSMHFVGGQPNRQRFRTRSAAAGVSSVNAQSGEGS